MRKVIRGCCILLVSGGLGSFAVNPGAKPSTHQATLRLSEEVRLKAQGARNPTVAVDGHSGAPDIRTLKEKALITDGTKRQEGDEGDGGVHVMVSNTEPGQ